MLLVPTRIEASSIHGIGLFAASLIRRGTTVWRFTLGFDLDLDPALVAGQPELFRHVLLHYGYDVRIGRFILCCDDARFINHSDAPNLRSCFVIDPREIDIAVREIAAGEEITIDYKLIERVDPTGQGSPPRSL